LSQGVVLVGLSLIGFVILYVLSSLILLSFRDKKDTYQAVAIATLISYVIAVFWSGYMLGTPDNPMYEGMLAGLFVPFVAVLAIKLVRLHRKITGNKGSD
jgi:uncharacterized MnhB-related membrane protein